MVAVPWFSVTSLCIAHVPKVALDIWNYLGHPLISEFSTCSV